MENRRKLLVELVRRQPRASNLRHTRKLREMLLGDVRVQSDPVRARFVGFGASSLDSEVFACVTTRDWAEFLSIREEILLRVMDIIEQEGTALAFPSQTLYLGRDRGTDSIKAKAPATSAQAPRYKESPG